MSKQDEIKTLSTSVERRLLKTYRVSWQVRVKIGTSDEHPREGAVSAMAAREASELFDQLCFSFGGSGLTVTRFSDGPTRLTWEDGLRIYSVCVEREAA
jgi:hypothetical protein